MNTCSDCLAVPTSETLHIMQSSHMNCSACRSSLPVSPLHVCVDYRVRISLSCRVLRIFHDARHDLFLWRGLGSWVCELVAELSCLCGFLLGIMSCHLLTTACCFLKDLLAGCITSVLGMLLLVSLGGVHCSLRLHLGRRFVVMATECFLKSCLQVASPWFCWGTGCGGIHCCRNMLRRTKF